MHTKHRELSLWLAMVILLILAMFSHASNAETVPTSLPIIELRYGQVVIIDSRDLHRYRCVEGRMVVTRGPGVRVATKVEARCK